MNQTFETGKLSKCFGNSSLAFEVPCSFKIYILNWTKKKNEEGKKPMDKTNSAHKKYFILKITAIEIYCTLCCAAFGWHAGAGNYIEPTRNYIENYKLVILLDLVFCSCYFTKFSTTKTNKYHTI